jgi:hypothetical protein
MISETASICTHIKVIPMIRIISLLALLILPGLVAQELPAPSRTVPEGFIPGRGVYKWERGHMLNTDIETATVFASNEYGQTTMQARIWPEDATRVLVYHIAVSPSGAFVVDASVFKADGASASLLAWLDASGRIEKTVQTGPAAAMSLCFADDGTLWALMRVHDDKFEEISDYDMLRQYDANGKLIRTALPRKMFPGRDYPGYLSHMSAIQDRIGIYAGGAQTWIEVSNAGEVLGVSKLPPARPGTKFQVWNAVLTPSNEVYFSASTREGRGKEDYGVYRFDKILKTLQKVTPSTLSDGPVFLRGKDGDHLVTSGGGARPGLSWVKPR